MVSFGFSSWSESVHALLLLHSVSDILGNNAHWAISMLQF